MSASRGGLTNPVLDAMMRRRSIRRYTDESPSDDVIDAIVRAGQQAPFAAQLGSVLLSRDRSRHPFSAPLLFTICIDVHRLEQILERRGWDRVTSDAAILLFGAQDAAYMAENMVIAAESLGLGSCFLGGAPFAAGAIREAYRLPPRVFPLVQLAMGFPAEDPPVRPRFPLDFTRFEGAYPSLDAPSVDAAMQEMDEGYRAQGYYRSRGAMIPLEGGREETYSYDDYGWTEHMGRKWGQWLADPSELLDALRACGFDPCRGEAGE